jgi:hypothetical protein
MRNYTQEIIIKQTLTKKMKLIYVLSISQKNYKEV